MANDLSAFKAEAWSKRLVQRLNQRNTMIGLVNRDYEGEITGVGSTVHVRTVGDVTMGSYTNGATISYQDLTPTVETFSISEAKYFAIKVDDLDRAQNDIDALDAYMSRCVVAVNNVVEAKILSKYSSTASANQITGASNAPIALDSTSGTTGIYYNVSKLAEKLSAGGVDEDGRWLRIHPAIRTLMWNDTTHFIRATDMGDAIVRSGSIGGLNRASNAPGYIGQFLGFDVYMGSTPCTDGTNNYLLAGTRDSITYAAQIDKMEALRLQTTFGNAVRGLLLHDAAVFAENAKRMAYVKCSN